MPTFETIADVEQALGSNDLSVRELYAIYAQRQPVPDPGGRKAAGPEPEAGARQIPWLQASLSLPERFTKLAMGNEEYLLACDAARETFRHWGDDPTDITKLL